MDNNEFKMLVEKAIMGDKESLAKVIEMYMPSIKKASIDYYTKEIDEECVSVIIEKLYKEIRNFKNI